MRVRVLSGGLGRRSADCRWTLLTFFRIDDRMRVLVLFRFEKRVGGLPAATRCLPAKHVSSVGRRTSLLFLFLLFIYLFFRNVGLLVARP